MARVSYEDLPHERPELEDLLPDSLAGFPLLKDSVGGEFAIGSEDLYLGTFPTVVDELVPAERRDDGVFFSEQLDRLWLVTGFFDQDGHSCAVHLYRVDGEDDAFWDRVVARLRSGVGEEFGPPMVWSPAFLQGIEVLRASGLGGNDARSVVLRGPTGLLELSLQGPDGRDGELVAALAR